VGAVLFVAHQAFRRLGVDSIREVHFAHVAYRLRIVLRAQEDVAKWAIPFRCVLTIGKGAVGHAHIRTKFMKSKELKKYECSNKDESSSVYISHMQSLYCFTKAARSTPSRELLKCLSLGRANMFSLLFFFHILSCDNSCDISVRSL